MISLLAQTLHTFFVHGILTPAEWAKQHFKTLLQQVIHCWCVCWSSNSIKTTFSSGTLTLLVGTKNPQIQLELFLFGHYIFDHINTSQHKPQGYTDLKQQLIFTLTLKHLPNFNSKAHCTVCILYIEHWVGNIFPLHFKSDLSICLNSSHWICSRKD